MRRIIARILLAASLRLDSQPATAWAAAQVGDVIHSLLASAALQSLRGKGAQA